MSEVIYGIDRTIPANTGRIALSEAGELPEKDHPREYGENG